MSEHKNQMVENFVTYMRSLNKSENTIKGYKRDVEQFLQYQKKTKNNLACEAKIVSIADANEDFVNTLTMQDLYGYVSYISNHNESISKKEDKSETTSATTRARKISAVKAFYHYLEVHDKISKNIASVLEAPKIPERKPKPLTIKQCEKLFSVIDGDNKERDVCIMTIFLHCGLRLSELVSLNVDQFQDNTLTIIGKGDKERAIYLNKACIKTIQEYLKVRPNVKSKALFISGKNKRIDKNTIQKLIKKNMEKAGIDTTVYHTHSLRATFATLLNEQGIPVEEIKEALGHSSINTTMFYVGINKNRLMKAVEMNPLNK
jgi:site-specific recombinase XerD